MDLSQLHDQRDILDRATIGVVQSDLDGIVLYANPCAMNLLGVGGCQRSCRARV